MGKKSGETTEEENWQVQEEVSHL